MIPLRDSSLRQNRPSPSRSGGRKLHQVIAKGNFLGKIVEQKKKEIARAQEKVSLTGLIKRSASLAGQYARDFKASLVSARQVKLIGEIKMASPSCGVLRAEFEPVQIARAYDDAGAAALSILTDKEFFQGNLSFLKVVKEAVGLPLLRKDFIIDEYQIYESVSAGSDALLLIVRLLSAEKLRDFLLLCAKLNLDAVCEVHSEEDLDKLLAEDFAIVGINNRNLDTFAEDLQVSARLIKKIPQDKIVISESGIKSAADVKYLQGLGVNAVLIGETFMRSPDIGAKVKQLMGY